MKPADEEKKLADFRAYLAEAQPSAEVVAGHLSPSEAAFKGRLGDGYVAVIDRDAMPPQCAPPDFRVLAIIPAYNEEDVIAQTIDDLASQGFDPYLIDNWSSDRTLDCALSTKRLIGFERFPGNGPASTYDLTAIMTRVEEVAREHPWAAWIVLHDADERRRSPWPGIRLREALWLADRAGFNTIDHVTINFWPVDDSFNPEADVEQHFRYFEFSSHPGHFHQRRAWKNTQRVSLVATAGHDVAFPGRRVYPYKFLLKHYPIRSQAQGYRKLTLDRVPRWSPGERALGWHRQYDEIRSLMRNAAELTLFDDATFQEEYLIERLSGAGVFDQPPAWATAPAWPKRSTPGRDVALQGSEKCGEQLAHVT